MATEKRKLSSKISITKAQRLQLIGLLALASSHRKQMEDIQKAVVELTGEVEGICGHCCDAIWSDCHDAQDLLNLLNVKTKA